MKKWMKLLALVLAAAMLMPAAALAAENEEDGPKLVVQWLDWDDGHFASDDALAPESGGAENLGYNPSRGDPLIFFVLDGDKKTPVLPNGDGNINVIKMNQEDIKAGAKQSAYYVQLEMKEFKDGQLTAKYKGKDLIFPVIAELPDAGYYSAPEATPENLLLEGTDPAALTELTAYFVVTANDEDNGRHVTDVKKSTANGSPSRWELEKVNDTTWKITLKADQDWIGVDLDVTFQDVEGNTYTEDRGIGFAVDYGPELWKQWLTWDDDPQPEDEIHGGNIDVVPADQEYHVSFYTCEEDGKKLTPVPADKLEASAGVTITPMFPGDAERSHYVIVTVDGWDKEYTISYNGYSIRLKSHLPEIAMYTKPEVSTDNFSRTWRYSAIQPVDTLYLGFYPIEENERIPVSAELADFENKDMFSMEKVSDTVYKVTRKAGNVPDGDILFNVTYQYTDGHTEEQIEGVLLEAWPAALVSEEPVWNMDIDAENMPTYASVKDKVSDTLTLKAGEEKTIYLSRTYPFHDEDWEIWWISAHCWFTSDPALKLTLADENTAEYTVSCDVPGTYTIALRTPADFDLKLYHADGKAYTEQEFAKFDEDVMYYPWSGKLYVDNAEGQRVPFEEAYPGESYDLTLQYENTKWYPVTVTVEADKPVELPFTDVTAADWYEPAVRFVSGKGYMNGETATKFNPEGQITGAEFSQLLYNKEGKPAAAEGAAFQGVAGQWYASAMLWAAGQGIITDTGDAAVEPEKALTRQQVALMLYNSLGKPEGGADMTKFGDAGQISAWAEAAMEWAVSEGVFNGSKEGSQLLLKPTANISRAEVAQLLLNYLG